MFNSQLLRCARKVLTLGVLVLALGILMFNRSSLVVKADDCNDAYMNLETCYYDCTVQCGGIQGCQSCYDQCEMAHNEYGITCDMPSYSPMTSSNYSCTRNSDQVMANCLAGTLAPVWQSRYLDKLVLDNGDMDSACYDLVWDYQNQECY